jgi:hypothetical protein
VYVSALTEVSIKGNLMVMLQNVAVPIETVHRSKHDPRVLEIDIETAWKALKLEAGFKDEVEVKVSFAG